MRNQLSHLCGLGCFALFACSTVHEVAHGVDTAASLGRGGSYSGSSSLQAADVSRGANEDAHWLLPDDYFISDRPYESGWIHVDLAKMTAAPTSTTKNEAQFFRLHDSKNVWSSSYWRTRPATSADLQIGTAVLCFQSNGRDGVYHAPRDKQSSRTGTWFFSRITDTSDLYKGAVMVATWRCAPDALRVPTQ